MRRAQGAYLKLLSADEAVPPASLNGDTAYTLMFGPDKCGVEHPRVSNPVWVQSRGWCGRCGAVHKTHFILRHKSLEAEDVIMYPT